MENTVETVECRYLQFHRGSNRDEISTDLTMTFIHFLTKRYLYHWGKNQLSSKCYFGTKGLLTLFDSIRLLFVLKIKCCKAVSIKPSNVPRLILQLEYVTKCDSVSWARKSLGSWRKQWILVWPASDSFITSQPLFFSWERQTKD